MTMMGDIIIAYNATICHHITIDGEKHPLSKGGVPEVEVMENLLTVIVLEEGAMMTMGETPPPN